MSPTPSPDTPVDAARLDPVVAGAIRRSQYIGQLRLLAFFLYRGMRDEFYHCPLIFRAWAETLEEFTVATAPWDAILGPAATRSVHSAPGAESADVLIRRVRRKVERSLNVLWEVARAARGSNLRRTRRKGEVAGFVRSLGVATRHVRSAVFALLEWQRSEVPRFAGEVGYSAGAFYALCRRPPEDPALTRPNPGAWQLAARQCEAYRPSSLEVALREVRDLIDERTLVLDPAVHAAVEELAAQNRTLPRFFLLCLRTRTAVQLAAEAAVFDPATLDGVQPPPATEIRARSVCYSPPPTLSTGGCMAAVAESAKPTDPPAPLSRTAGSTLLSRLHTLIRAAGDVVAPAPAPLRAAIARRRKALEKYFPDPAQLPDPSGWRVTYFAYAGDPGKILATGATTP